MNEILKYLLIMVVLTMVAKLLTYIRPYKISLIKRVVKMAEIKYADASKSGKQKKAFALKILKWCLIQTDDATSNLIDIVVSIANTKTGEMTDTVKTITSSEIDAKLNDSSTK